MKRGLENFQWRSLKRPVGWALLLVGLDGALGWSGWCLWGAALLLWPRPEPRVFVGAVREP